MKLLRTFIVLAYDMHGNRKCQTLKVYFGGTFSVAVVKASGRKRKRRTTLIHKKENRLTGKSIRRWTCRREECGRIAKRISGDRPSARRFPRCGGWFSRFFRACACLCRGAALSYQKHRKELINIFIYRIVLYDDKMKVLFNLKGGQKNELLLNLIFPDYPDGNGENESEDEKSAKEKEADKSTSLSGYSYTPRLVNFAQS